MKKLLAIMLGLGLLLMGNLGMAAEGTKVLGGEGYICQLTVPEMAPEFLDWRGMPMAQKAFPNGQVLLLVELANPEESVFVLSVILVDKTGKPHIIALQVTYFLPGWDKLQKAEAGIKTEFYLDKNFMLTGLASDEVVRVEKEPDWNAIQTILEQEVKF